MWQAIEWLFPKTASSTDVFGFHGLEETPQMVVEVAVIGREDIGLCALDRLAVPGFGSFCSCHASCRHRASFRIAAAVIQGASSVPSCRVTVIWAPSSWISMTLADRRSG